MGKVYITRQQVAAIFDGIDRWARDDWEAFGIDFNETRRGLLIGVNVTLVAIAQNWSEVREWVRDEVAHRRIGGK